MNIIHVKKHSGRATIAAAIAGLLAGMALLSAPRAEAIGVEFACHRGEFCLYYQSSPANSGYYHFTGSDTNLDNDFYEGLNTTRIVGNSSRYVRNSGESAFLDDVVVYSMTGYRGEDGCLRRGADGTLPPSWADQIESYRWVTDTGCAQAGILWLENPPW